MPSVVELKTLCKKRGICGYSKLLKADLCKSLKLSDAECYAKTSKRKTPTTPKQKIAKRKTPTLKERSAKMKLKLMKLVKEGKKSNYQSSVNHRLVKNLNQLII